jgi:acetamidase/formamidase
MSLRVDLKGTQMRTHRLDAAQGTVHWGFFDASLKPVVTVESGDEITISTVSGAPEAMPQSSSGLTVPAALSAIHASRIFSLTPNDATIRDAYARARLNVGTT